MCEVPPIDPHNRRVKKEDEEEEEGEDLVDQLIKKSGCENEHYLVQECMVEHRDWRRCQQTLKNFQACLNSKGKAKSE